MSSNEYDNAWQQVRSCNNISDDVQSFLSRTLHESYQQDRFGKPMPWIGMYIALASLFCILAMAADLVHGFRNRKLWFPCKYFTLNAVSLTVIAVTIKLPMDLNNIMPTAAKVGSMAFTCTMMANLLPSLATMDSKELLTNIIALVVLVITLVVNICIQVNTGVFSYTENYYSIPIPVQFSTYTTGSASDTHFIAIIYVVMLLMLLIIHICSSLAILKSKRILELKYQKAHETNLKDRQPGRLTIEKLKEQVSNYWIMAETGSPQFMTACSATTSAAGIICVLSTAINILFMLFSVRSGGDHNSDYKWSMGVILIIQYIGVIIGTIAPLFRCFGDLSFKLSIKWIWNHIKVFQVESYWTQKLSDWKQSSIPFSISSRKSKIVLQNIKILVLSFFIGFQKTVVVACKMIAVVPIFFVICVLLCMRGWKCINAIFRALGFVSGNMPEQLEDNRDSRRYVLQLQDDKEVAQRTLNGFTKSVKRLIQKAEKKQPNKLMKLLEESSGFEGVGKYDSHQVPPLLSEEYPDCWSLTVVTLTTIVISLSNTQDSILDRLWGSVSEGLAYVTLVEENLNATDEYVIIQKAAKMLWLEVEVHHKWLGKKLKNTPSRAKTAGQVLEWFRDTSKHIVTEVEGIDIEGTKENSFCKSICANSMYRITQTILLSYQDTIDKVSQEELFVQLSAMIADILAACLTNLPQVIAMKCHTSVIEKRGASVHAAAQLLGETTHIINNLQDRELPSLNPNELPFIDKWHNYFKHPFP